MTEPDFVSFFNSYKIYHIAEEEYKRLREEEDKLNTRLGDWYLNVSLQRRFFLFKDQHFTYCRQTVAPLLRAILAVDDNTHCIWFHSHKEPPNAIVAYISHEYQRILATESCHHHNRDRIESIITKIIVSKYWDELQIATALKPVVEESLDEFTETLAAMSSSISSKGASKPKAGGNIPNNLQIRKKKAIPLALKRKVWDATFGEDVGKALCPCCKLTIVTQMSFSCGHIIAEFNGGELKLDNLRPICSSCNSSMGTKNMDQFISKYGL